MEQPKMNKDQMIRDLESGSASPEDFGIIVPEPPEPWEVLGFRRFTHVDWYGFAGAESFLDGSEPLIYYGPDDPDDGSGFYVVIDATGVHAERYDPVGAYAEGAWIGSEGHLYDAMSFLAEAAKTGQPLTWATVRSDTRAVTYGS